MEPAQREKCVTVNKAEQSWGAEERFDMRHGGAEFEISRALSDFALVQYFLNMFLPYAFKCAIKCWTYVICFLTLIFLQEDYS